MKKFTHTFTLNQIISAAVLATGLYLLDLGPTHAAGLPQAVPVPAAPARAAVELPALPVSEIVARNAAARGGLPAWQAVHAMSMVGTLEAGRPRKDGGVVATTNLSKQDRAKARAEMRKALQDGTAQAKAPAAILLPFTLDVQRPLQQRIEVPFQGQTAIQVFDGNQGWKLRPYLGRHEVEPFTGDELRVARFQQPLEGALLNYQAKGTQVALEGGELVEGHGAYRLKLTLKNGDVLHTWIDAQTFLDLKIDGAPRRWDGRMHGVATYLRDYKAVDGLLIAHRMETVIEGVAGSENIYVQKVSLNPLLPSDHFARPQ